ncbi:MAG: class I SAM-dependent methyltransferase [Saccharofermentanaceae bacterium]|jgi:SAM-dependent methyltransferase|nr:class I SAM-dependent methyltransferase [Clostridia bacterium]NLX68461.1 class I SAM-dependent methyltransferase [Clostridiaceae bacterium]HOO48756.1 class I SAM-dependent methyltransferase [Saccharofermentans sp.]HPE27512.1 class I SAM-dependent methyltransferase [Saccharofermentans sp.]HPG64044.1 class I SAM-dependent methyltransferase [Saccharofermentans sp.]
MCDTDFYDFIANEYDIMQSDLDPKAWALFVHKLVNTYSTKSTKGEGNQGKKVLCDLGCGTGLVDVEFDSIGYEVIGIDKSLAMLNKATQLCAMKRKRILFINQDITKLDLHGSVDVFVSLLDTVNHLDNLGSLSVLLEKVKLFMNPDGVFVFDLATPKHFKKTLGNNVFFEDYDEFTLLWANSYDTKTKTNEAELTIFRARDDGTYDRMDGQIEEKCFSISQITKLAKKNGLIVAGVYGDLEFCPPRKEDERVFIVLKKEESK